MSALVITWLLVLADAAAVVYAIASGAPSRRRARELRERETVAEGWATALYRREMELHNREYRLRWAEWMGHR